MVREVLKPHGLSLEPPTGGAQRERWESLLALVELAEELESVTPGADLARFVTELDLRAEAQHPPTVEGVTLASLHAAKGLEWDAVFLIGLTEGTMPIQHADSDEAAIEEERRLLYVGVTRARLHLGLSWALSRSPGGRGGRRPSRFLDGLRPGSSARGARGAGAGGGGAERGQGGRKRRGPVLCRVCGRPLSDAGEIKLMRCEDCPSDLDEELYERLRAWRMEQAKALGQPAYCVFTDKTLLAIAEVRPVGEAELSSIAGVGARKLDRFGADVLALVVGEEPGASAEPENAAEAESGQVGAMAEPWDEDGEEPAESSEEEAEK
jgi:DNA helicase-2/ATP-dependent DNA helicase PcrA